VLLDVEKQQLERLYQQHLVDEDYLQKVCCDPSCLSTLFWC
jgi:hypothetical protein